MDGHFLPGVALSSQNTCVTQWLSETWNEGMEG